MPNYRAVLAYDGGPFKGFAAQPDVETVEGKLTDALNKVSGEELKLSVAGRTDAGVHALGQVVSFRTKEPLRDIGSLPGKLTTMCGPSIAVNSAEEVAEGFDARFSALSRTYEYAVLSRELPDPFSRHTTWHHPSVLDVGAMRKAAELLVGEHDFSSFGRVMDAKSPVRTIETLEVLEEGDLILIRVMANSFIQQMVRSLVGTLIKVGESSMSPDDMQLVLEAKDRAAAGPVAPPHGLFLVSVSYPEDLAR